MLFFRYFTGLFWIRWMGLFLSSALILTVFEFLSMSDPSNYWHIFKKLPFGLHKMFPFITFVSMLMFTWRLIRPNEWQALSGMGRSPWQIIRTPLIWASFLGLMDLFVVVPLGQQFFNPFESKKTDIALHAQGWRKGRTAHGYLFMQDQSAQKHILEFDHQSILVRHVIAQTTVLQDQAIVCRDAWDLRAHQTPCHQDHLVIDIGQPLKLEGTNKHPLLLSLGEVNAVVQHNSTPSLLLSARWHYWWSHFFWSLALVPLAAGLLLGQSGRYWKMLWAGGGIVGCLTLYLIKEWLYAISIPLAHSWPIILLWIPSILTAALAWGLFFEKKEV